MRLVTQEYWRIVLDEGKCFAVCWDAERQESDFVWIPTFLHYNWSNRALCVADKYSLNTRRLQFFYMFVCRHDNCFSWMAIPFNVVLSDLFQRTCIHALLCNCQVISWGASNENYPLRCTNRSLKYSWLPVKNTTAGRRTITEVWSTSYAKSVSQYPAPRDFCCEAGGAWWTTSRNWSAEILFTLDSQGHIVERSSLLELMLFKVVAHSALHKPSCDLR